MAEQSLAVSGVVFTVNVWEGSGMPSPHKGKTKFLTRSRQTRERGVHITRSRPFSRHFLT